MVTREQDPDILKWGLDLLLGDTSIIGETSQDIADNYYEDSSRGNNYVVNYTSTENDAIIAHALQEELSQLAVEETSGSSHEGTGGDREERDMERPNPCSSSGNMLNEGEEFSLELTEFSVLDGEVGKRLNQMVPVPHVPKINGEIPSVDEAMSDHERLLERLQLYELAELKVQGDGNCQFRALSDQFYRTPEHHEFVREQVVNQLKALPDIYEGYVTMGYEEYISKMSTSGEWGDHVTLQAAADSYGVKIFILTSFKDTCYIEILPNIQKSQRVIFLSFWAEVHYNSIYPKGELPVLERKKKRRWWHLV